MSIIRSSRNPGLPQLQPLSARSSKKNRGELNTITRAVDHARNLITLPTLTASFTPIPIPIPLLAASYRLHAKYTQSSPSWNPACLPVSAPTWLCRGGGIISSKIKIKNDAVVREKNKQTTTVRSTQQVDRQTLPLPRPAAPAPLPTMHHCNN